MEDDKNRNGGGFTVNVYSPGNMFANRIEFNAPVYLGGDQHCVQQGGYTDQQIAAAIEAVCGMGKPVSLKQQWAGIYWCLRWYCNFPIKGTDFCERVRQLPFTSPVEPECDWNNFRRVAALTFMNQDCRFMDKVTASKSDQGDFLQCRTIVMALAQELGKQALPKGTIPN